MTGNLPWSFQQPFREASEAIGELGAIIRSGPPRKYPSVAGGWWTVASRLERLGVHILRVCWEILSEKCWKCWWFFMFHCFTKKKGEPFWFLENVGIETAGMRYRHERFWGNYNMTKAKKINTSLIPQGKKWSQNGCPWGLNWYPPWN